MIFGGGRRKFLHQGQADPEYPGKKGERLDRKDLIQQWLDKHNNSRYVWNQVQFDQIDAEKVDHVIGMLYFFPVEFQFSFVFVYIAIHWHTQKYLTGSKN